MNSGPNKTVFLVIGGLAVFGFSFGAIALYKQFYGGNTHWSDVSGPTSSRQEKKARCEAVIGKAEAAAKEAVGLRAKQFHDFVAERQYRTVPDGRVAIAALVEDMLTLGSKGRLVWSKMPFTDRDGYTKHVNGLFSKYLFSAEELGAAFNQAVEGAVKDVEAVENQLAVELQIIITGTQASPGMIERAPAQLRGAIAKIVVAGQVDVGKDVAKFVASEIVSQVGVQVLIRTGVSAGILGAGVASSPWTFGAGALLGFAADAAWGWIDNPEANIREDVIKSTSKIAVDGMNAINEELDTVVRGRKKLWELSANDMLP